MYYEASLIPIIYIIIKWGSYPERSLSSIMLLIYTSVFTLPFLYVILKIFIDHSSLNIPVFFSINHANLIFSFIIFLTFGVKLPIYGLHYWLPIAHVEAPTFGSMVLAGVLLKLGGVGLIRLVGVINVAVLKQYIFGYSLVFLLVVTIVCCFQSDFKRLVAYSSVSHIIAIPILFIGSSFIGLKGLILVMFIHGISSPLLFILVGLIYSLTSTRQHFLIRGLIVLNPLLSFLVVLSFFFTLSAPPFPSFVAEVFFYLF